VTNLEFLCPKTRETNEKKIAGNKFPVDPDSIPIAGMGSPILASAKIPFKSSRRPNRPGTQGIGSSLSFPSSLFEYHGERRVPSQFIPETANKILPAQTSETETQDKVRAPRGRCGTAAPSTQTDRTAPTFDIDGSHAFSGSESRYLRRNIFRDSWRRTGSKSETAPAGI